MSFSSEIKKIRQVNNLSQEALAKKLGVAFSTVNRWENDRIEPSAKTMKNIKKFCQTHGNNFKIIESEWLKLKNKK